MRIAISGVERSLGRFLCQKFLDDSHEVVIVPQELLKDTLSLIAIYEGCTCIINLVGEEAYECMQSSDVESIRDEQNGCIVEAFANMKKLPELFICISSNVVTSKIKGVRLISQWEKEVMGAENHGVRSVAYATNIILGKNEMTKKLFSVFKRGFGRGFKNSDAFFNWVHQDDIYGAILWAIEDKSVKGAYNLVAPDSMKNSKFYELLSTTV